MCFPLVWHCVYTVQRGRQRQSEFQTLTNIPHHLVPDARITVARNFFVCRFSCIRFFFNVYFCSCFVPLPIRLFALSKPANCIYRSDCNCSTHLHLLHTLQNQPVYLQMEKFLAQPFSHSHFLSFIFHQLQIRNCQHETVMRYNFPHDKTEQQTM